MEDQKDNSTNPELNKLTNSNDAKEKQLFRQQSQKRWSIPEMDIKSKELEDQINILKHHQDENIKHLYQQIELNKNNHNHHNDNNEDPSVSHYTHSSFDKDHQDIKDNEHEYDHDHDSRLEHEHEQDDREGQDKKNHHGSLIRITSISKWKSNDTDKLEDEYRFEMERLKLEEQMRYLENNHHHYNSSDNDNEDESISITGKPERERERQEHVRLTKEREEIGSDDRNDCNSKDSNIDITNENLRRKSLIRDKSIYKWNNDEVEQLEGEMKSEILRLKTMHDQNERE